MVLVSSGYSHFFKYISGYREIIRIPRIRIRHTARNHNIVSVMPGVLMNLCCLMSYWSSASWCPAAPLLPGVLLGSAAWCPADPLLHYVLLLLCWLVSCWSTAAWYPAASPLTGPLQIYCCMLSCCFSANWRLADPSYCSSVDWCPANPLLHDVHMLLCWLVSCRSTATWRQMLLCPYSALFLLESCCSLHTAS